MHGKRFAEGAVGKAVHHRVERAGVGWNVFGDQLRCETVAAEEFACVLGIDRFDFCLARIEVDVKDLAAVYEW